jgi:hypothetical protein
MLAHSPRYRPILSTHMLSRQHRERMQLTFGPLVGNEEHTHYFGASFWVEIR